MNATKSNPVLEFVLNAADTAQYVWKRYADAIARMSWKKLVLASLLLLIAGGMVQLQGVAQLAVFVSVVLKCVLPKPRVGEIAGSASEEK